ncbi:MAG: MraY family glycosyltransferase [Pseudomonadota bacterium]
MSHSHPYVLIAALALLATAGLIALLRPVAGRLGWLDEPGAHKTHDSAVPVTGGIAMFLVFAVALLLVNPAMKHLWTLVAAAAALVVVGALDDRYQLSYRWRFMAQTAAGLVMTLGADTALRDMGYLQWDHSLTETGLWQVPLTVFCVVGVINALNMLDGLDGLAGTVALIAAAALAWFAFTGGRDADGVVLLVLAAVLAGFLSWNWRLPGRRRARVFMGDAGSLSVGFVLAWFVVSLSQLEDGTRAMLPVQALWVLCVPLMDTVRLLVWRAAYGTGPFKPDRQHLHHVLQRRGWSHGQAAATVIALHATGVIAGLVAPGYGVSEFAMFYAFMALFFCYAVALGWEFDRQHGFSGATQPVVS